jgi:ABC-type nickel/cobalt efflux system permease component RcnA
MIDKVTAFFRGVLYVLVIAAGIAMYVVPLYMMLHFARKYW